MMICFGECLRDKKVDFYFQSGPLVEVLTTTNLQHISCAIEMTITSEQCKLQGLLNSFIVRSDKMGVKNLTKS